MYRVYRKAHELVMVRPFHLNQHLCIDKSDFHHNYARIFIVNFLSWYLSISLFVFLADWVAFCMWPFELLFFDGFLQSAIKIYLSIWNVNISLSFDSTPANVTYGWNIYQSALHRIEFRTLVLWTGQIILPLISNIHNPYGNSRLIKQCVGKELLNRHRLLFIHFHNIEHMDGSFSNQLLQTNARHSIWQFWNVFNYTEWVS